MVVLSVRLKPSRRLVIILGIAHFIAAGLLWPLSLPVGAKLFGIAAIALSLNYYLKHYALLSSASAAVAFELSDKLECTLETRCGKFIICKILASTFVAPYLVVLNLKPIDNCFLTRSITILPDGIDAAQFRRLRVLLRWKWKAVRQ